MAIPGPGATSQFWQLLRRHGLVPLTYPVDVMERWREVNCVSVSDIHYGDSAALRRN
ncbi:uncharacterized protein THITE_152180 [Thermothielavioides terrestris NRRL 8126]|uniref:Uncharacterized protein n=1 Tax=Thermothielavioides terrestris (strain ATCC 38088 / NRRL 8126) TaxID=578455 RepID=G2QZ86_THETT|nr:uncharacterized protein THITE_152180 [Thermothielavioides terrestris NRRL 8126]AEO66322.1 hypothetical protein THITE_152180 [Thermothielavioides terrestris NRRL 8126]